jgi:membrane protease YdiL (CAAX protease family)
VTAASVDFWTTVRLLLRAARRRSVARQQRQSELLHRRKGSDALSGFAIIGALLFAGFAHGIFSTVLDQTVQLSAYHAVERDDRLLVSEAFERGAIEGKGIDTDAVRIEARNRAEVFGGERTEHEERLRRQLKERGRDGFIVRPDASFASLSRLATAPPAAFFASLGILTVWFLMMAFQGEGLELDVQRHRHPMWEWLFSHPIPPAAAFVAEMLTPLAANPIFLTAPLFWAIVLGKVHGDVGILAGVAVGLALGLAASCFSKAIEIGAMIRLPPRSRGAVIGIMSWLGYAALVVGVFSGAQRGILVAFVSVGEHLAAVAPAAPARWVLGVRANGETSLALAIVTLLTIAAVVAAGSVWLTALATNAGLAGSVDTDRHGRREGGFLAAIRDPLLRKELLWFARDRSAVVQAVLIPLTMGAVQAFQFRTLAKQAGSSWNWLCGLGVICGTYMLSILGPRSLTSEGGALWLALTWPRGLEPLLKAKARLWWIIASAAVLAIFGFALTRFPGDAFKIGLVTVGWLVFGRSLAEKMVTLVVPPSSSGEPEPVPRGRRWAAQLGTFSFGFGVVMGDWHLALLGVTFSSLTSAAMWENFRERLPYLFDPVSERMPPPPTLMHAMVAITALADGMAVVAIPLLLLSGGALLLVQAMSYGITALVVWLATEAFLSGRGVPSRALWSWPDTECSAGPPLVALARRTVDTRGAQVVLAAGLGLGLAAFAIAYEGWVMQFPWIAEKTAPLEHYLAAHPDDRLWLVLVAVGFAPLAEEYLFRGLLLRALDRQWGGWSALLGTTLFFTVYHPPIAWPAVGLVGLVLAVLAKATGSLWPGVLLHAVYNAAVTLAT